MQIVDMDLMRALADEAGEPDVLPAATESRASNNGSPQQPGSAERCWHYIDRIERSIAGQKGHDQLWRAARVCVGTFGLTDSEAADLLHRWNTGCQPEWSPKDLQHKIEHARTNMRQSPVQRAGQSSDGKGNAPAKPVMPVTATAICLADVVPAEVTWCWEQRMPYGMVTLQDGDPGLGKTLVMLQVAALETLGQPKPGESVFLDRQPGRALILNAEDDLSRTLRGRLESLGADLSRCYFIDEVEGADGKRPLVFPDDLPLIEKLIRELGITLVIVDPLFAFPSESIDTSNDASMRRIMHGLRRVAEATQAAIVVIRHLNKMNGVSDPMYRGGGSIGIIGAVRSALLVAQDPDDEDRRILAAVKCNLCRKPESLAYRIVVEDGNLSVAWEGPTDLKATDLLKKSGKRDQDESSKVRTAETKVLNVLDEIDPEKKGVSRRQVRDLARISGRDMTCAVTGLLRAQIIEDIEVEYKCGKGKQQTKTTDGIRRKPPSTGPTGLFAGLPPT